MNPVQPRIFHQECNKCGNSFSQKGLVRECPECGSENLKQIDSEPL